MDYSVVAKLGHMLLAKLGHMLLATPVATPVATLGQAPYAPPSEPLCHTSGRHNIRPSFCETRSAHTTAQYHPSQGISARSPSYHNTL